MTRRRSWIILFCACAAAVLLDCMHYTGAGARLGLVEFCFVVVMLGVVFFPWPALLVVCLGCGFVLDAVSATYTHIPSFLLFAAAGRVVTGFFTAPRSVFNLLAQALLFCAAQVILFVLRFGAHAWPTPHLESLLWMFGLNSGLFLVVALAAPRNRPRFEVYRL